MASNNLRIMYQNIIDMAGTVIVPSSSASTTYTPIASVQSDLKSRVWRSATSTTQVVRASLAVSVTTATNISGIVLAFCNLSSLATIRVRGFTGTTPTVTTGTIDLPIVVTTGATMLFDTGEVLAAPYLGLGDWNWGTNPLENNAYSNTNGYARQWLANQYTGYSCTSFVIDIYDPSNINQYIQISRIIMGNYWSPKYNTSYGMTSTVSDMSESSRTEAGDLVSKDAPIYSSISLDLKYMNKSDRSELFKIIRLAGTRRAVFLSVFPNNTEDWGNEQIYQCYGKFVQLTGISHVMFEMYSSQIEIEEI